MLNSTNWLILAFVRKKTAQCYMLEVYLFTLVRPQNVSEHM